MAGIRFNGVITQHADQLLHDYLVALPPGQERGRAFKQIATIGLLMMRGHQATSGVAAVFTESTNPRVAPAPAPASMTTANATNRILPSETAKQGYTHAITRTSEVEAMVADELVPGVDDVGEYNLTASDLDLFELRL
jgi:hypothetical protein